MKELVWIIIALLPSLTGFLLRGAQADKLTALALFAITCCLAGSFGVLRGKIEPLWLKITVTIFLAAGFFFVDYCVAIGIGCTS